MLQPHPPSSLAITVPFSFLLLDLSHLAGQGDQHGAPWKHRAACLARLMESKVGSEGFYLGGESARDLLCKEGEIFCAGARVQESLYAGGERA